MTKAHSELGDNGGLCEGCSDPATEYQTQTAYPVLLGGGIGWATMWLCRRCLDAKMIGANVIERFRAQGYRVIDSRVVEDRDPGDEDVPPSRWV